MPFPTWRGHGGSLLSILFDGAPLGTASSIDFTGAGQTTTILGSTVTVNIPGAGTFGVETPSGTIDGTNTIFTAVNDPEFITLNGAVQTAGVDYTLSGTYTITFVVAPTVGSILRSYY